MLPFINFLLTEKTRSSTFVLPDENKVASLSVQNIVINELAISSSDYGYFSQFVWTIIVGTKLLDFSYGL